MPDPEALDVFLFSDFGWADPYAGQMRANIVRLCVPGARLGRIIDVTHGIARGDVLAGAAQIAASLPYLPAPSVVVAVVDPGVGTGRRALACRSTGGAVLIGPDNGLFSMVEVPEAWLLPGSRESCSSTFHGRDLFAVAAAGVCSAGSYLESLEPIDPGALVTLHKPVPRRVGGSVECLVAWTDSFGNVVLWADRASIPDVAEGLLELPDGRAPIPYRLSGTYSGGKGLLLLEGSQGLMELALDGGSASEATGLAAGDSLALRGLEPSGRARR
ncbi:SAM-dependent chlorinase/fluorinase [Candidatus Fermentibacterales bacterium]|nr:SAM-dependent chlorinase/fluorinase [Candidatus Fermentibacterales bacterium]